MAGGKLWLVEDVIWVPLPLHFDEPRIVGTIGFPHALLAFIAIQIVDVDPCSRVRSHRIVEAPRPGDVAIGLSRTVQWRGHQAKGKRGARRPQTPPP